MASTKEAILINSLKLFAQNGFEAVSVSDIAQLTGVAKSALYKHFKNKRDIFSEILKRMEQQDGLRAKKYLVPEDTAENAPEEYKNISFQKIVTYTAAQYGYWTQDPFAAQFRKMLELERHRDTEMAQLYSQYILGGPVQYMTDIFAETLNSGAAAQQLALSFYAPVYFLITLYDTENDKKRLLALLNEHLSSFTQNLGNCKT